MILKGHLYPFVPLLAHFGISYSFLWDEIKERVVLDNFFSCDFIARLHTLLVGWHCVREKGGAVTMWWEGLKKT